MLAGLLEFLLLRSATQFESGGLMLGLVLGFNAACGLVAALAAGIVLPPLLATLKPGPFIRHLVLPGGDPDIEPATLNGAAAWLLAALAALLPFGAVAWAFGGVAHGFNQSTFAGPFVALGALIGVFVGGVALFPARAAARFVLDRIAPTGRLAGVPTPALPLLFVLLGGGAVVLKLSALDLGAYKLGALTTLGVALGLTVAFTGLLARRVLRSNVLSASILVATAALAGWALSAFSDSAVGRQVIAQDGMTSRIVLNVGRKLMDSDGDGFSAALAGGDCDEGNPAVHPGAREIPGNNIDDNCVGGDAPLEDIAEAPPPVEPAPDSTADAAVDAPPKGYQPSQYNVVFILIDTLRPDHLGLHGYARDTSPNLDAWAKTAVVFDQATAHAPNTPRSVPSLFTGRYPSRIQWINRFAGFSSLKPENRMLFEMFSDAGYQTEVLSQHWYFERAKGIKQGVKLWNNTGFMTIKKSNTQSAAPVITKRLVGRLDALSAEKKPFFILAHYFDAHSRYLNHKQGKIFGKKLMDKYDSEIAFVDHHLKTVFEALERNGLYENTVVVVTADHGEAFREHGFYFHGRTVYQEEMRIPMLIRAPKLEPRRIDTRVGLVDLLPTLTGFVGIRPDAKLHGQSLVPMLMDDKALADRTLYLEQLAYPAYKKHIVGAVDATGMKVIRNLTDNVTEIYDLVADPAEKTNLAAKPPAKAEALRKQLDQFIDGDPG